MIIVITQEKYAKFSFVFRAMLACLKQLSNALCHAERSEESTVIMDSSLRLALT